MTLSLLAFGLLVTVASIQARNCSQNEFECRDEGTCIEVSEFCDGTKHCSDGSDEPQYATTNDDNVTLCRGKSIARAALCILPQYLDHDRSRLCRNSTGCTEKEFACHDGSFCLRGDFFCDGRAQCRDGTDDMKTLPDGNSQYRSCPGKYPYDNTVGQCLLREEYFCDGEGLCEQDMDECSCGNDNQEHLDKICFRCFKNSTTYIPISKLCDGAVDCPDLTDECLCQSTNRPKICDRLIWEQEEPFLRCKGSSTSNRIDVEKEQICGVTANCSYEENVKHCQKTGYSAPFCVFTDKLDAPDLIACDYLTDSESFSKCISDDNHCKAALDEAKVYPRPPAMNSSLRFRTCSVDYDPAKQSGSCLVEYTCTDVPYQEVSIIRDCKNQDTNCTEGVCRANCNCTFFNCDGAVGGKYIHGKAVCDEHKDCASGIDECQPGCIRSAFSDEQSLITNKGVLVVVWIFSIFAIVGCTVVVISTLRDFVKTNGRGESSSHSNISKVLILSLSVSDLLVGVYTIAICIKAVEVEGRYCTIDLEWRTSSTCSSLGALLIIGSEQSVLTMVLITVYRLRAVMRPFSTPTMKRAIMVVAITWMMSVPLGLIPIIPAYEDYFLKHVSFNDTSIFKTRVSQTDRDRILNWFGLMSNGTNHVDVDRSTQWAKLRRLLAQLSSSSPIRPTYEFGYYSSHTVCLPTLFPDRQDTSWVYSFLFLVLNFLAFFLMLVCYIALYRKANNNKALESAKARDKRSKQSAAMQRKVTRILVSDFLCWMPVCIMGFLQMTGVAIPNDAYLPTGLLILPINSALNPFLYSNLPDRLLAQRRKIASRFADSFRSSRVGESTEITLTTRGGRIETIGVGENRE